MITLYKLYDFTGYHPHSRTKWLRDKFSNTTKEAKSIQIKDYEKAYDILRFNSKTPNLENLHLYFPEQNIPAIVLSKLESHSDQMIDIMNKQVEEEIKSFPANIRNDLNLKPDGFIPMIIKDDYEVLKNSFDDLLEMYQNQERRLLVLEKRLELPKRAFRNEIINAINTICHKKHREQQAVYKEVYQGFDIRYGLKDKTKNIKTTYLEWYDQNDYLPRLLNYIKEVYKT